MHVSYSCTFAIFSTWNLINIYIYIYVRTYNASYMCFNLIYSFIYKRKFKYDYILQVAPRPNTFMAFGNGVHSCPGSELAKLEMLIFLHHLTTTYR